MKISCTQQFNILVRLGSIADRIESNLILTLKPDFLASRPFGTLQRSFHWPFILAKYIKTCV